MQGTDINVGYVPFINILSSRLWRIAETLARNALLPNLLDADKDWIAKKAATNHQVTVATAPDLSVCSMCCDCPVQQSKAGKVVLEHAHSRFSAS